MTNKQLLDSFLRSALLFVIMLSAVVAAHDGRTTDSAIWGVMWAIVWSGGRS
jgi:hypothetical protein